MLTKDNVTIGLETRFGPNWSGVRCGARTKGWRKMPASRCEANRPMHSARRQLNNPWTLKRSRYSGRDDRRGNFGGQNCSLGQRKAKCVRSIEKQEQPLKFIKGQNEMYKVTSNQKEQLMNQVLNTLTNTAAVTKESDWQFLLSMYEKVQRLRLGQSLSVTDALKLKSLIKKATS